MTENKVKYDSECPICGALFCIDYEITECPQCGYNMGV